MTEFAKDIRNWPKITCYGGDFREELKTHYEVITELGLWDFFKNEKPPGKGYMFWDHPNLDKLMNHPEVDSMGHSGMTFALACRHMQEIAKIGFYMYTDKYTP